MIGIAVPVMFIVELATGVPDITVTPDVDDAPTFAVVEDSKALLLTSLVTRLRTVLLASDERLEDVPIDVAEPVV